MLNFWYYKLTLIRRRLHPWNTFAFHEDFVNLTNFNIRYLYFIL